MHENLQRHRQTAALQLGLQALQIAEAEFPGQHHTLTAELRRHRHPGVTRDRHLGGGMQSQTRRDLGGQQGQTDILDDQGIHAGSSSLQQQLGRLLELIGEHENVQGQEPLNATSVQPGHHLGQILATEVLRTQAGVEALDPEIDGISSVGHRRAQRLPAAGRCQKLRKFHCLHQRSSRWAASKVRSASADPSKRQCQGS